MLNKNELEKLEEGAELYLRQTMVRMTINKNTKNNNSY